MLKYVLFKEQQMKNIVIFDFDNTIVNSIKYWRKAINVDMFKFYGLRPIAQMKKVHGGKSNQEIASAFLEISGLKVSPAEILKRWYDMMFMNYTQKIKLIKGVREYLNKLKAEGKKLILASATGESLLLPVIKHLKLDMFDLVFTEDMIGSPKRDPMFFVKLLNKIGAKPEDVFLFEDSLYSISSASSLKIESCALINPLNKANKPRFEECSKLIIKNYKDKRLKNL